MPYNLCLNSHQADRTVPGSLHSDMGTACPVSVWQPDLYSTQLLAESTQVGFSQSGVNSARDSSRSSNVNSNQLKTQAAF